MPTGISEGIKQVKRVGKFGDMAALNVWILYSLNTELESVCAVTGQSKGDAVNEALRYWLNAQYQMGVKHG